MYSYHLFTMPRLWNDILCFDSSYLTLLADCISKDIGTNNSQPTHFKLTLFCHGEVGSTRIPHLNLGGLALMAKVTLQDFRARSSNGMHTVGIHR